MRQEGVHTCPIKNLHTGLSGQFLVCHLSCLVNLPNNSDGHKALTMSCWASGKTQFQSLASISKRGKITKERKGPEVAETV